MSVPVCCLWRSVWLPRAITAVVVLIGVPLFLRMALWCDLTLYDLAAKNLLDGGVPYRDLFDTNFPGFVWLLAAIRWVVGFGAFPLRCVDVAIVTGVVMLMDRLAKWGGATPATRGWAIAGAAIVYLGAVEQVHCQRDIWMMIPALGAVAIRLRRSSEVAATTGRAFWKAALEGALWGVAVWIKPHCVLMAAGVWLVTAPRVAASCARPWAGFAADVFGNLVGGGVVGLVGITYLVALGAWPQFWEVVTVWAPEYTEMSRREFHLRKKQELYWFPPWSLWLVPTVPLAVLSILDSLRWRGRPDDARLGLVGRSLPRWLWDREAGPHARFVRATLAALWLVWASQAYYIQRGFEYVHIPETVLMLALWAAHRWAMPAIVILWITTTSLAWFVGDVDPPVRDSLFQIATHDGRPSEQPDKERYIVRYPLLDPQRLRLWPECWQFGLSDRERYGLWDRLERVAEHEAVISWEELGEVADFLRSQGIQDRELLAWHDSPHALYMILGIKPGLRYLHINTVRFISPEAYARVQQELAATAGVARYAVSDLEFPTLGETPESRRRILGPPADPPSDLLPAGLQTSHRVSFPFNQKTVFRSRGGLGRYIVHELTPPLRDWPLPSPKE